ncbi:hypothetical protein BDP55DRAFT_18036 [Colletotrichum godetiae]|uniref:Uncharacterized protein n=1 Tax=Colletotrichum godetiae TaxID=1209918 RepID=A0AAJ0B009_9PEZI|nr:uncharacterized protein BDP55DRAFT_18036 [Colletotrichum godetiae]KAK1701345.1 hypothetical protein BDP55DRAFT_18036 [Colletotrichum godetiae]
MSILWSPIDGSFDRRNDSSRPPRTLETEEDIALDTELSGNLLHDRQNKHDRQNMATVTSDAHIHQLSGDVSLLGRPAIKKSIYKSDVAAAATSMVCLALGILAVSHESISWRLGVGNNQLIVVGFLLSAMSLCLASVTPTLFILVEARYGESTIQNYDAILRNKPLASKLGVPWRIVLILTLALPIGLSVAYKIFTGGESRMKVNSMDYIPNITYYGMFQPPGTTSFSGISIFFNATTAFREDTALESDGSESPLPALPHAYGYNVLLLNTTSVAALDTLHSEFLEAIQQLLAVGESWTITAPVLGTVATFNESSSRDRPALAKAFLAACQDAEGNRNQWSQGKQDMLNWWALSLTNHYSLSDQSLQYLGIAPQNPECEGFSHYVYLYNIYRQRCWGTWSVTRGSSQLLNGSCEEAILSRVKQLPITYNNLALDSWYISPLMEMLSTFSGTGERGNLSHWMTPYMATSVATMLWSRIAVLQNARIPSLDHFNMSSKGWIWENGTEVSHREVEVIYSVDQADQSIFYKRPTLQKSPWLYLVLAIQPLLIVIILGLTVMLHSEPLGRGFGLVSILSGIDRQSLNSLAGASLSGELSQPVKLTMSPVQNGDTNTIQYRTATSSKGLKRNGKLSRNVLYH